MVHVEDDMEEDDYYDKLWKISCIIDLLILALSMNVMCVNMHKIWLTLKLIHRLIYKIYKDPQEAGYTNFMKFLMILHIPFYISLNYIIQTTDKSCKREIIYIWLYIWSIYYIFYIVCCIVFFIQMLYRIYNPPDTMELRTQLERIQFVEELAEHARRSANENEVPRLNRNRLIDQFSFIPGSSMLRETECSICLERYSDDDLLMKMPCEHEFHIDCAETWLRINLNCPICRRIFTEEEIVDE